MAYANQNAARRQQRDAERSARLAEQRRIGRLLDQLNNNEIIWDDVEPADREPILELQARRRAQEEARRREQERLEQEAREAAARAAAAAAAAADPTRRERSDEPPGSDGPHPVLDRYGQPYFVR